MTTYYVSASGSDSNNGTSTSTPWQTVSKVNASSFSAGDSVSFRGGDIFSGTKLWITSSRAGTAANHVIYGSYGTGRATISITSDSAIYVDGVAGVTIQDLILSGGGSNTHDGLSCYKATSGRADGVTVTDVDVSGFYHGISVGGASGGGYTNVSISNCDTHGNKGDGLNCYGPAYNAGSPAYAHSNVTITNVRAYSNTGDSTVSTRPTGSGIVLGSVDTGTVNLCAAHDNGASCPASDGPVGIWAYDSTAVTIKNCVSYNNSTNGGDGDGFDLDQNCSSCIIEYCLAYGNYGAGILIYTAQNNLAHLNNTVRYNLCWGNVRSSVVYHGEVTVGGLVDAKIYNNTLVAKDNTATTNPPAMSLRDTSPTITARNNILYQLGSGSVVTAWAALTSSDAFFQGNDYYRSSGLSIIWNATTYTTLATWRAAVANYNQETLSGSNIGYTIDPLLVTPGSSPTVTDPSNTSGANGLKLQSTSSVAGAGLDLNTQFGINIGTLDYFSGSLSSPYSIGAHEL